MNNDAKISGFIYFIYQEDIENQFDCEQPGHKVDSRAQKR